MDPHNVLAAMTVDAWVFTDLSIVECPPTSSWHSEGPLRRMMTAYFSDREAFKPTASEYLSKSAVLALGKALIEIH